MPEITLELLSLGKSEKYAKPEVRFGREPSCDVVFPSEKFPMVGRQHALLRSNGGGWSVEDLQSINGTYVNQSRIQQRQQLAPGDTVRLGSDGPEIRVQFVDESYAQTTRPAAQAAVTAGSATTQMGGTRPSELPPTRPAEPELTGRLQIPPTKQSEPGPTRPSVAPAEPPFAVTKPSPPGISAEGRTIRTSEDEMAQPGMISPGGTPEKQDEIADESEEEDAMTEQKLSLLRNLVIFMVGLVLVLGGIVISQMQQLADIRQNVVDMREEGREAVKKFNPELDKKMNKLESDMNAIDERMQKAQDKFMVRMEAEMPKVLDKYVDKKMKEINSQLPPGVVPTR
jgi:hypothetical protein